MTEHPITIALNKGRILNDCLPLLAAAGIEPAEPVLDSRKLIFATNQPNLRFVIIRSADVPTFVEHGAADLGITGKDTLLEHDGTDYYECLDLRIARCRLMTAGVAGAPEPAHRLRVATKFVNIARRYYAERGRQIDLIHLNGAMELAPLVGLADRIVDIVESGNTLKANGLVPLEPIAEVSSRLVANKASLKIKNARIAPLLERLEAVVAERYPEAGDQPSSAVAGAGA